MSKRYNWKKSHNPSEEYCKAYNSLSKELERLPTKADFINNGLYAVWMADYRSRKRNGNIDERKTNTKLRFKQYLIVTNDTKFIKSIFDLCKTKLNIECD